MIVFESFTGTPSRRRRGYAGEHVLGGRVGSIRLVLIVVHVVAAAVAAAAEPVPRAVGGFVVVGRRQQPPSGAVHEDL